MKVIFKNLSSDLSGIIKIKNCDEFEVQSLSEKTVDIEGSELVFYVKYIRDFTFGLKPEPKNSVKLTDKINDKMTEKLFDSIGNAVVQIVNVYKITDLKDGAVIEIKDRAHYVKTSGVSAFFKCLPALYYFGQAECQIGKIEVVSSYCINRYDYIKFYKFVYSSINMSRIFNIIKYKVQIHHQKKISEEKVLTETFQMLYSLPYSERDYQFKPLRVIADRVLESIKEKLPKRVYNKLISELKKKLGL